MPEWDRARCLEYSDSVKKRHRLFFSDLPEKIEEAKSYCATCPIRSSCLREALTRSEAWGVWGGTDWKERQVIAVALGYDPPVRNEIEHGTEAGWAWHRRQRKKDPHHQICEECRLAYNSIASVRQARYRKRREVHVGAS